MVEKSQKLHVRFFCTEAGNEPVRIWLEGLERAHKRAIGIEIRTVQMGWPIGMPVVRKLEKDLWEVRVNLGSIIARILFTVETDTMILLHGFIKKSQKIPADELDTAKQRKAVLERYKK